MQFLILDLGNLCRGPIAAAVFGASARRIGRAVQIDTAGVRIWRAGEAADGRAVAIALERGYDLSTHLARPLRPAEVGPGTRILCVDARVRRELGRIAPEFAERAAWLHPLGKPIPDPYEGRPPDFEHAFDLIEEAAILWLNADPA